MHWLCRHAHWVICRPSWHIRPRSWGSLKNKHIVHQQMIKLGAPKASMFILISSHCQKIECREVKTFHQPKSNPYWHLQHRKSNPYWQPLKVHFAGIFINSNSIKSDTQKFSPSKRETNKKNNQYSSCTTTCTAYNKHAWRSFPNQKVAYPKAFSQKREISINMHHMHT